MSCSGFSFKGCIAAAVLQEAAGMTITPELSDRESSHADLYNSTEKEENQAEKKPKERAEVEAAGDLNQGEEGQKEDKEENKNSLPEESLRMTSWVEVENEKTSTKEEPKSEVEVAQQRAENSRDVVEEQVLLEAEMEQTRSVEEELAMMEEKWREQCAINETLKQRLADEEERFRVSHFQGLVFLQPATKGLSAFSHFKFFKKLDVSFPLVNQL